VFFATRAFWVDLAERAVSTFAQAALGVVTAAGFGLFTAAGWRDIASVGGVAGVIAILKAFAVGRGKDTATPAADATADPQEAA
jgi:hypothetical protein